MPRSRTCHPDLKRRKDFDTALLAREEGKGPLAAREGDAAVNRTRRPPFLRTGAPILEVSMTGYNFACKDIGMTCGFEIRGATSKDEIFQEAAAHAKVAHKMATIPPDVATKVSAAIHA
ncbi:MAG: DUF1059 domain-containing protein [Euryarchaeota archaeon]|nr:DUF1059 domain-containing protein [Euryarchaeota archaeon]